jgi:hypothetical protein
MNKMIKRSLGIILAAGFAGCASQSTITVNEAVGPDLVPARAQSNQGSGQLVVYSALETPDIVGSSFPTHAGYEIYDANGKLLRRVDNRSGSFYQVPVAVSLPSGEYKVKARATNHGLVIVPVIIEEDETTTLDLEGTHFRPHDSTGAGQWVRLPTGEVIGMRAP